MLAFSLRKPLRLLGIRRALHRVIRAAPLRHALVAGSLLTLTSAASGQTPAVVLVQESNGFPGGEQATDLTRQKVTIRGERLRVLDPRHMWALFIALSDRTVREAAVHRGEYEERAFDDYERYREDRARSLAAQRREFERLHERAVSPAERRALEEEYRKLGGDPAQPGRVVVRLEEPGETKSARILVDREPREVTLERFLIRENQKEEPAFDLWVTRDVDLPVNVLAFYRALGPFGEALSEKLSEVPGAVIECTATLDTGTFHRTFRSRVVEVRLSEAVAPEDVAVPPGWEEVDPEAAAAAAEAEAVVVCVITGEEIPLADALSFRDPRTRRRYYVAGSDERRELIELLARDEEPPHAGRGGR